MKKKVKIFTAIILVVIATLIYWARFYADFSFPSISKSTSVGESEMDPDAKINIPEQDSEVEFVADPSHQITYTGWIPSWASADGQSSFTENINLFDDISPVWYGLNEDGSLLDRKPANYIQTIQAAQDSNTLLIPSIAMFDFELFSKVLQSEENLDRHVDAIMHEIELHSYDGIDLDYESTALVDKDQYFVLLEKLSTRLHAQDKVLVVTVLAKWGDNINYPSLPETRAVQDWEKIATYADEIRIMAYDYTFSKALLPGPIAPIDWVENVLDYAVTKIPRDKIVLGVHLYSYEWYLVVNQSGENSEALSFQPDFLGNSNNNPGQARSYTYNTVQSVLMKYEGDLVDFQGEKIFRYSKVNDTTGKLEDRVLVYIDREGVELREQLAKNYNIKGVAFWRLGGEGELLKAN